MELKVKDRNILGKKVKKVRQEGFIPAELYGHQLQNRHLLVLTKEFAKIYQASAGRAGLITLITETGEKIPALIKEVQINPLTREFLNIDFHQVKTTEIIKTKIPLNFLGEAPAVKEGYILVKVLNEVEVEALPQDIPQGFDVNLESLKSLGQNIHLKDLKVPSGVKILIDPETVIATVTERAKEEAAPAPAPAASAVAEAAPPSAASSTTAEESAPKT